MKRLSLIPLLSLIFMLNVASTCSDDNDSVNSADPTPVINTVNQGTWRITFYEDSGVNETTNYSNYIFTFGANSVLTAANSSTFTGSWSVTRDNSNDDTPNDDLDFNIFFASPAPASFVDDLTDDWSIISYGPSKIELVDVSGGSGGTDYLTFEKN
ncbi:hypothetical protein NAT47_05220 [Flavobacterium sp. HXWNR69]|uniref:Lipocalin-like domain-containing protein n=1 Tax=Flavobacterium fragile TaxID=2949085 RepID=A0ABT0TFQ0_9FLAO|nr:hypothetical protein [Flavobacterium sp. HXWNR69]MCL9769811.1 hypothetical protein [Flavobacterium sp. HXWNR69]